MLADGATRHWHDEHKVPWMVYKNQWWGYDDEQSVRMKMKWLKKNGFGKARMR
jgi:chitinase